MSVIDGTGSLWLSLLPGGPAVVELGRITSPTHPKGRSLHSVPIFAQLQLTLPLSARLKLTRSPIQPELTRGCVPNVRVELQRGRCVPEGPQVEH